MSSRPVTEKRAKPIRRRGRPPEVAAASHAAILDAVYALLRETSVGDLTMEQIAERAGVGRPTLYKWWPSKAALVLAMFHERLDHDVVAVGTHSVEATIRAKVGHLVREFNGLFGKAVADLIAAGQSEPPILQEFYERHVAVRRAATAELIERARTTGEFQTDVDAQLLIDAIYAPIYLRLLLRNAALTEEYGERLVDQAMRSARRRV